MKATYYQILTVTQNATTEQIKLAYRKQCGKYHPDRNSSPNATLFMQVINEAYACLSDVDKRYAYDLTLHSAKIKQTQSTASSSSWQNFARKEKSRQEEFFRKEKEYLAKEKEFWEEYNRIAKHREWILAQKEKERVALEKEKAIREKERWAKYDNKEPNYAVNITWDNKATEDYLSRWIDVEEKDVKNKGNFEKIFDFFKK
jgi:DnaJ-class molecular chaperone